MIEVARTGTFQARWSDEIHDEWTRSLKKKRPDLDPHKIEQRRAAMDAAIPDCLVTGYESQIAGLTLPDPTDHHVLAAAIVGRADVIVTFNLKHFPDDVLSDFQVEAQHPDTFLIHQRGLNEQRFLECARRCRRRLKNPPKTPEEYLDGLRAAGLVLLAAELCKTKSLL